MNSKIPTRRPIANVTARPAPSRFDVNAVKVGLAAWLTWRLPLGATDGWTLPDQKITSFALTSRSRYVEMHKLMFSDAEIFS
jgi:hypothetical protein